MSQPRPLVLGFEVGRFSSLSSLHSHGLCSHPFLAFFFVQAGLRLGCNDLQTFGHTRKGNPALRQLTKVGLLGGWLAEKRNTSSSSFLYVFAFALTVFYVMSCLTDRLTLLQFPASLPTYRPDACGVDGGWIFCIFLQLILVFTASPACSRFLSVTQRPLCFWTVSSWGLNSFPSPVACPILLERGEPLQAVSTGKACAASRIYGWKAVDTLSKVHKIFCSFCIICLLLCLVELASCHLHMYH